MWNEFKRIKVSGLEAAMEQLREIVAAPSGTFPCLRPMLLVIFIIRTRVLEENKTGTAGGGAEWETKAAKRAKTRTTNRRN